jgi:uncharacterized metal-binding protein YceD (DUF177 family)
MDIRKRYDIHFKGLGEGEHRFCFDMDDRFFGAFEGSEVKGGKATADVVLNKSGNVMLLEFDIKGSVTVECDRCLEDCEMPIDFQDELRVRLSDRIAAEGGEYDGEVLWLGSSESELNIAQYIYESIVLSLPYQRVHADVDGKPGCNPEMLERFSIVSEEEFENMASEPEMQKMAENPEWEKLRKLKEKMK